MKYLSFPVLQKIKRQQESDVVTIQVAAIEDSENIQFVVPDLQHEFSLSCTLSNDEKIDAIRKEIQTVLAKNSNRLNLNAISEPAAWTLRDNNEFNRQWISDRLSTNGVIVAFDSKNAGQYNKTVITFAFLYICYVSASMYFDFLITDVNLPKMSSKANVAMASISVTNDNLQEILMFFISQTPQYVNAMLKKVWRFFYQNKDGYQLSEDFENVTFCQQTKQVLVTHPFRTLTVGSISSAIVLLTLFGMGVSNIAGYRMNAGFIKQAHDEGLTTTNLNSLIDVYKVVFFTGAAFYLFFQLEQFALAFRGASWMFNAVRDTCCSRHTLFSESAASTRRESQDDLLRANPRDENNMFHDGTNN